MDRFQNALAKLQGLFLKAAEVMAVLVALIVLVYILLGEDAGPYVTGVVTNLSLLIFAITPQTIIAIALVICLYIALKKRV
ncbi:MAG TPA: hypothetical protein VLA27_10580 [Paracoccaceae bacterium]|nr:hypothetical protein [Paracoccaceae bacterium]